MRKLIPALCATVLFFSALPASAAVTGIVRGNVLVDNAPRANVNLILKGEGSATPPFLSAEDVVPSVITKVVSFLISSRAWK